MVMMWLMFKKPTKKQAAVVVSGTGPGYIPAFQGFPEVGASGV